MTESNNTEFKEYLNRKEWDQWLKTLCGFSNTKEGIFILDIKIMENSKGF